MLHNNAEDQRQYLVSCTADPSLAFGITAPNDDVARAQALDKIGYAIVVTESECILTDADNQDDIACVLKSKVLVDAQVEAMKIIGWLMSEPQELIGGTLGSGFGLEDTGD